MANEIKSTGGEAQTSGRLRLFFKGVKSPFEAWGTVREHRGLKRYFVIPFFINVILLVAIVYLSAVYIYPLLLGFLPQGDAWYLMVLRWLVTPVLVLVLAVIIILLYSITGSIITAPFNDPLSARVENLFSETVDEPFSLRIFIGDIVRMAINIIKLILLLILFYVLILFLNLIPVLGNLLYALLSFLGTIFFLGFQFFDFPLERMRLTFREKIRVLWQFKSLTMGLGLGFFLISFIPIFGFLGLNLATVGGTVLYLEYIKPLLDARENG